MTLKLKLFILTFFSIIIILSLGIKILNNSYNNYKKSSNMQEMILLTENISSFVHELQKERGLSAAFLTSESIEFKNRLVKQRIITSKKHKEFKLFIKNLNPEVYDEKIRNKINKINKSFENNIELTRELILIQGIDTFEEMNFYTNINNDLLSYNISISKISNNPLLTNEIIAFNNLLFLKDRLGLERAIGSIILQIYYSDELSYKLTQVISAQDIYKENFYNYASDEDIEHFNININSKENKELNKLRMKLLNWNKIDKLDIESTQWFDLLTKNIDNFHSENIFFITKLIKDVKNHKEKSKYELIFLSLILFFAILIFSLFTYMIQNNILKSLNNFKIGLLSFFSYINQKSVSIHKLDDSKNDEFGYMSKIVNRNIDNSKRIIDENKAVLDQAILILDEFKKGNLHQRLNINVKNPTLNNLKNILNQMANNLEYTIEQLEETNEEYEVSLENLKKAQEQLIYSEKMSSLGGLVAGVAHEINTPVGIGITGSSHLLEMTKGIKKKFNNENMGEEDFLDYLKNAEEISILIDSNLKRAGDLVKSFKQIAVDQTSEEKRYFYLNEYIREILLSINSVIKKTKLNIKVNCSDSIRIKSYPGLLSQVITNLIMNSLNHAYEQNEQGNIQIDVSYVNNKIEIIYQDDGKGIKKEYLNKIFDPFFTTNRENGGSGLGLNIIYNIITKQLNGNITCESTVSIGTKFIMIFSDIDN